MLLPVGFIFELLFNSCHFRFIYRYFAQFALLFEVEQLLFISYSIVIEPFHRGLEIFEKSQFLEMRVILSMMLFQWLNLDFCFVFGFCSSTRFEAALFDSRELRDFLEL